MADLPAEEFVGRDRELELLRRHAFTSTSPAGILLLSAPSAGASELLRRVFDRLFTQRNNLIPFYFAFEKTDKTAVHAARRYLRQFLVQSAAFRRKDAAILTSSPDMNELSGLAAASDALWFDPLLKTLDRGAASDERAFVRNAISAPLQASERGSRVFVIVDDLHYAPADDGISFVDELTSIFDHTRVPFIFSARRRSPINILTAEVVPLDLLDFNEAGVLVETLANKAGVPVNDQTRDLIAAQFGGDQFLIRALMLAARETRKTLESFQNVQRLYADEIVSGRIAAYYKNAFESAISDPIVEQKVIELIHSVFEPETGRVSLEAWERRLGLDKTEFKRLIRILNINEFVDAEPVSVKAVENEVLRDYVEARYRRGSSGETTPAITANVVTTALRRAPRLMERLYRRQTSADLQQLVAAFDCQDIPLGLIDYRVFKETYKGTTNGEITRGMAAESERFLLPQIAHSAAIADHYPPMNELIDPERTAYGAGFFDRTYSDENEVVWLAAEIESKLEASRELTGSWIGVLEDAAAARGLKNYRIWLVSPEGFSPESLDLLAQKNATGSSRRQVDMLRRYLEVGEIAVEDGEGIDYDITIPVGEDTELIAAQMLEEIAKRYDFPAKSVNQIKTALVEACINAVEHGHSPDRKIYQRFSVREDRIVITVSNRGIKLTDKLAERELTQIEPPREGRRGWGLNLIKGLMD
ncbi:MAG TPA: ATP-binding protein, partial [Pyrinomonadaceae bacterium]|nr:ATP-binding protein [Pyrinomonadaceae bacterium]